MELQQHLNLITRVLKQTVGLQHIHRENVILNIRGSNPFFRFLEIRPSALKQQYLVFVFDGGVNFTYLIVIIYRSYNI